MLLTFEIANKSKLFFTTRQKEDSRTRIFICIFFCTLKGHFRLHEAVKTKLAYSVLFLKLRTSKTLWLMSVILPSMKKKSLSAAS